MVNIIGARRDVSAVVLEIEMENPKDQHFHVIPDGVLETRMDADGVTAEEAVELVLTEAHGAGHTWTESSAAEVAEMAQPDASVDAIKNQLGEIVGGYERRDEELKAADFVQDIVEKFRAAKVKNSDKFRRVNP